MEVNLARARVAMSRHNVETMVFNKKYPIMFDEDGHAYRLSIRDYVDFSHD